MNLLVLAMLAAATGPIEAPVTEATLYGDRARVVRTADVDVNGVTRIELPLLEDTLDLPSLRVEADGATVDRVEVKWASAEEFPEREARKLLNELEQLDDAIASVQSDRDGLWSQLARLQSITPVRRQDDQLGPPHKLDPSGWSTALQFMGDRELSLDQKVKDRDLELRTLSEKRQRKAEEAALIGGPRREAGYRVTVQLSGNGKAKVRATYVAQRARWSPLYELSLDTEKNEVQLAFYGVVSQETGEDWKGTALTLSTAIPSAAATMPKVFTWKIGERDRFIPTPQPVMEPIRPPPPAPPISQKFDFEKQRRDQLIAELSQRVSMSPLAAASQLGIGRGMIATEQPEGYDGRFDQPSMSSSMPMGQAAPAAPPPPPAVRLPVVRRPPPARKSVSENSRSREAAPAAMPAARDEENEMVIDAVAMNGPPRSNVGLSPPPSYQPPPIPPGSPAALAGGFDLAFDSARREDVGSGKGARKVALFSEKWPVTLERKLFPALAPYAFLVAELKSPSTKMMPGGQAQLFVGQDPAGVATLELIRPGQTYTLPLGVDRAIKSIRNVELLQGERGFIGKDDVGKYVVTIEVANPYRTPLAVHVLDQWPLQGNEKAQIKLEKTEPAASKKDDAKGQLEWTVTIPPNQKTKLSYTYTLTRPKDWRLEQRQEAVR